MRVDALRIHVHRNGDDVRVARALAVAEQRALDAVCAREKPHLGRRDGATAVVVRVQADHDVVAIDEVFGHIFHLLCKDVRHRVFDGRGQVDDRLAVGRGLPHLEHGVADLERILGLGAREGLGAVFEAIVRARLFGELFEEFRALDGDLFDLLFVLAEHLLALGDGGGVVDVHDDVLRAADGVEGLADDVLARLR